MTEPGYVPYEPQLIPVAIAEDVWTVEGPEVGYRIAGATLPCPTRMTVVRLAGAQLWLHSPVCYSPELAASLRALGEVRFIVAPNTHHHVHIAEWAGAFPQASLHASPDHVADARPPFDQARPLSEAPPPEWGGAIRTSLVTLSSFVEALFFHVPSRTLIVTDLMQNFEPGRVRSRIARSMLAIGGATGPIGSASIEIRLAAVGRYEHVKAARDVILSWGPARVILAHGACYEADAKGEVRRAFAWVD